MRVLMLVLLGALVVVVACEAESEAAADPTDTPQVMTRAVTYIVTTSFSNHEVSLTYQNATGNSEQLQTVVQGREWKETFRADPGEFLYVSVQNRVESGTVACKIVVDGVVVEDAESSGAFVIATCSGRAS